MLVLSRKKSEVIRIGDDIKITVVRIIGDKVRIGIDAPRHLVVDREEVFEAKLAHGQATTGSDSDPTESQ